MARFKSLFLILLAFIAGSFVSLVTTIAIAQTTDNLIHACVRNNILIPGAPNIRIVGANTTCNTNETALNWPKTGGNSSGGTTLKVIDSQAQEIGVLLDNQRAVRKFGNYWVSLDMTSGGFSKVNSFFVVYETSDCSGNPYLSVGGIVKNGIIVEDTVYYPGDPQINFYSSSREFTPPNTYGECNVSDEPVDNINGPLQSSPLPSFTPPFSIQDDA